MYIYVCVCVSNKSYSGKLCVTNTNIVKKEVATARGRRSNVKCIHARQAKPTIPVLHFQTKTDLENCGQVVHIHIYCLYRAIYQQNAYVIRFIVLRIQFFSIHVMLLCYFFMYICTYLEERVFVDMSICVLVTFVLLV